MLARKKVSLKLTVWCCWAQNVLKAPYLGECFEYVKSAGIKDHAT